MELSDSNSHVHFIPKLFVSSCFSNLLFFVKIYIQKEATKHKYENIIAAFFCYRIDYNTHTTESLFKETCHYTLSLSLDLIIRFAIELIITNIAVNTSTTSIFLYGWKIIYQLMHYIYKR